MTVADMTPLQLYGVVFAALMMAFFIGLWFRSWPEYDTKQRIGVCIAFVIVGLLPAVIGANSIRASAFETGEASARLRYYDAATGDLIPAPR